MDLCAAPYPFDPARKCRAVLHRGALLLERRQRQGATRRHHHLRGSLRKSRVVGARGPPAYDTAGAATGEPMPLRVVPLRYEIAYDDERIRPRGRLEEGQLGIGEHA